MLSKMIVTSVKRVREELVQNVINLLFTYRYECASNNQPSQLVLPENYKRNLLYLNCALKNPVSCVRDHPSGSQAARHWQHLSRLENSECALDLHSAACCALTLFVPAGGGGGPGRRIQVRG